MKIEKPGLYRTLANQQAQILDVRGEHAVGWVNFPHRPLPMSWNTDGTVWSGRVEQGIVAEWRDPVTETVTLELCLNSSTGNTFARFGQPRPDYVVLARRTITLREGEGMSSG